MDKTCKGLAWVGNMYQKFEAMCLEVDDIVREETVRYVENQMQTVGANVKQFCSEFMQDMLSSTDKVERTVPDLSLVQDTHCTPCEKLIVGINEDHTKKELLHSSSDEPVKEVYFGLSSEQSLGTRKYEKSEESVKEDPIKENHFQLEMSDMVAPLEKDSGIAVLSQASDDATGSGFSTETGDVSSNLDASTSTSSAMHSSVESCEGEVLDIQLAPSDASTESVGKSNGSIAEEVNDVTKVDLETIQSFDEVKLGESCIMVDSAELSSVSREAGRHRSFKKKLQEAFASRKRVGKQDCDQHAAKREDLDVGSNQQVGNDFPPSIITKKYESPDDEFSESDWEII